MSEVTWKGAYCYKEEFDDSDCHGFDLRVTVDDDEFYGTAPDQEFTSLTGDVATVEGFIEGDHISFTKKYPYLYILEDDGTFVSISRNPGTKSSTPEISMQNYIAGKENGKYTAWKRNFPMAIGR